MAGSLDSELMYIWRLLETEPHRVGERIRAARQNANITLAGLAERVGRSMQAVQQWEKGDSEPGLGRLVDVARALGADPIELILGIRAKVDDEWYRMRTTEVSAPREVSGVEDDEETLEDEEAAFGNDTRPVQRRELLGQRVPLIVPGDTKLQRLTSPEQAQKLATRDFIARYDGPGAFAYQIADSRNAKRFLPGDVVVLANVPASPGELVLVSFDGQVELGRLRQRTTRDFELVPLNKYFSNIDLGSLSGSSKSRGARVLGVVVEHSSRLKVRDE